MPPCISSNGNKSVEVAVGLGGAMLACGGVVFGVCVCDCCDSAVGCVVRAGAWGGVIGASLGVGASTWLAHAAVWSS